MNQNNNLGQAPWILVVDDDHGTRGPVESYLRVRGGYQVDTAKTLAEARARLASGRLYAVAVLDTNLPDGCGYDLVKNTDEGMNLREYNSPIRPVLVAVSEVEGNQVHWKGIPFLHKGVGLGTRVVQTIDSLLDRK